jgi:hypothetical protein
MDAISLQLSRKRIRAIARARTQLLSTDEWTYSFRIPSRHSIVALGLLDLHCQEGPAHSRTFLTGWEPSSRFDATLDCPSGIVRSRKERNRCKYDHRRQRLGQNNPSADHHCEARLSSTERAPHAHVMLACPSKQTSPRTDSMMFHSILLLSAAGRGGKEVDGEGWGMGACLSLPCPSCSANLEQFRGFMA